MRGGVSDRLLELAAEQRGYVTAGNARAAGIDPVALRKLAATGRVEQRAWGVYRVAAFPPHPHDEYREAVLWAKGRAVVAGEAALALWDLADVNPRRIDLIVPPDYQPRARGGERYRVARRRLDPDDVDEVDGVPVLGARRAVAEAIRAGLDDRLVEQAIDNARRRRLIGPTAEARLRVALADRSAPA